MARPTDHEDYQNQRHDQRHDLMQFYSRHGQPSRSLAAYAKSILCSAVFQRFASLTPSLLGQTETVGVNLQTVFTSLDYDAKASLPLAAVEPSSHALKSRVNRCVRSVSLSISPLDCAIVSGSAHGTGPEVLCGLATGILGRGCFFTRPRPIA